MSSVERQRGCTGIGTQSIRLFSGKKRNKRIPPGSRVLFGAFFIINSIGRHEVLTTIDFKQNKRIPSGRHPSGTMYPLGRRVERGEQRVESRLDQASVSCLFSGKKRNKQLCPARGFSSERSFITKLPCERENSTRIVFKQIKQLKQCALSTTCPTGIPWRGRCASQCRQTGR